MARDYRREITAAVQAGSLSDLAAIAHQLLGKVEHDDERRARAAEKKALERAARKLSATNGMSPNVAGHPATNGDVADTHPSLLRTTTTPHPNAREELAAKLAVLENPKLSDSMARAQAMIEDAGESWEDVAGFFLRRRSRTWQGWVDAFNREVGMTSQFQPADLVKVCRDDATLDQPIKSAFVLRTFLQPARIERMGGSRAPPSGATRDARQSRRDIGRVSTGPALPPSDPDVAPKWQT